MKKTTTTIAPADMLLFAAVVREASFTRAARVLGLSKQSVSERVRRLEESLGVRLLERTTRRMRVTEVGAAYAKRCTSIASQMDEANSEVRDRQAEPNGLLRVSAPVLYGRRFLAPVVADMLQRYPKTRVEIVLADRRVDLVEEGVDLAIRVGDLDDSSLTARKLDEGFVYYVASPRYLKEHGAPRAKQLASARCVTTRPRETWEMGTVTAKIEPVLMVNDLEVACDCAVAGVGIARLPTLVCADAIRDGRLKVLFGPEPAMRRSVYAVYPSRQFLPAKVRVFLDALAALGQLMSPVLPEGTRASRTPRRARAR